MYVLTEMGQKCSVTAEISWTLSWWINLSWSVSWRVGSESSVLLELSWEMIVPRKQKDMQGNEVEWAWTLSEIHSHLHCLQRVVFTPGHQTVDLSPVGDSFHCPHLYMSLFSSIWVLSDLHLFPVIIWLMRLPFSPCSTVFLHSLLSLYPPRHT